MAGIFEIVERELTSYVTSRPFLESIGKKVIEVVKKRTQSGYGVNNDESPNPTQVRLKALSSFYINEIRRNVISLGEFGAISRSNATLSGQMLKALKFSIQGSTVTIEVAPTPRANIPLRDGKRLGTSQTNQQVSDRYSEFRPYLALTTEEQRIITQFGDELIQKFLDQKFK